MMLRNREYNKGDRQRQSPEIAKRKPQNYRSATLDLESITQIGAKKTVSTSYVGL